MNEEKYNPNTSDSLEVAIVDALRERQRKEQLIRQWEGTDQQAPTRPRRITMRPLMALAAVACTALLLVFAPWHGTSPSPLEGWIAAEMEASRAAFPGYEDLAQALHAEDYLHALDIVNQSIAQSEAELEVMGAAGGIDDEESAYERTALNRDLEESRWVRICLLIQLHRIAEAEEALHDYCRHADYVLHGVEASQLLNDIRKGRLK